MNARLAPSLRPRPRIGFLGLGWIGRKRLQALAGSGVAEIAALADAQPDALRAAAAVMPGAYAAASFGELLEADLDGVVIATPSGAHAGQAIAALDRGLAVFCQKPLTRTSAEAEQVVAAARRNDCLLDVDYGYRLVAGVSTLRQMIQSGELGELYAVDLAFHNAYGPDKPWLYDARHSGGGCVMDLGSHLIDLALWATGCSECDAVDARRHAQGRLLPGGDSEVEDYATAQWRLATGASVRMSCSWRLPAGCDAVFEAAFYGTRGGVALRNVAGSFCDFAVERFDGAQSVRIAGPPDAWDGRTLVRWAGRLACGERFDPAAEHLVAVARLVDRIYGR